MPDWCDTHAHLYEFEGEVPEVLQRARSAGVSHVVAVGITVETSARCVELMRQHPGVRATVGFHPNEVGQATSEDWDRIRQLAKQPDVVGIGETGLDRYWDKTPFAIQEEWFVRHLELGCDHDLAVVIHCREAETDVVRVLREQYDKRGPIRAVMHSFCGSKETAEACLAMGLTLSFAGMLTYKNAQDVRDVAAIVPLDRVMVETDCPYLAPVPKRGKRNEPAYVIHTGRCLASVLGIPEEQLAAETTKNANSLFRFAERR